MLEGEIIEWTGIKISLLNPTEFITSLSVPVLCIIGNDDELVKQKEFLENYAKIPSKIK